MKFKYTANQDIVFSTIFGLHIYFRSRNGKVTLRKYEKKYERGRSWGLSNLKSYQSSSCLWYHGVAKFGMFIVCLQASSTHDTTSSQVDDDVFNNAMLMTSPVAQTSESLLVWPILKMLWQIDICIIILFVTYLSTTVLLFLTI